MQRLLALSITAAFLCAFATTAALAHAFLDKAIPAVGSTVNGSPKELQLTFTEGVVPAFSGVHISVAGGAAVPAGKPTLGPANTLHVRLGRPLKPGTYEVSWHVVSVDTHHTSGTYRFTVAP
jgi:methionine-rich copper-binding protein CopC